MAISEIFLFEAALRVKNGGRNRTRICDLHDVNVALQPQKKQFVCN